MSEKQRNKIRFNADDGALIIVELQNGIKCRGLASSESVSGCGGVFLKTEHLKEQMECQVTVGELSPLKAVVRWIKVLDDEVIRVGFEFLN